MSCKQLSKFFKFKHYLHLQTVQNHSYATMLPSFYEVAKVHQVADTKALSIARELLMAGDVIALPTDTVYGLACDANNEEAMQKLYHVKGRDCHKPVAICVKDLCAFRHYGQAEHLNDALLERLLPGPITIVIERSRNLKNRFLNPSSSKIGMRIPDFQFIQKLCALYDEQPLALTSANRSAERSSLNVQEFVSLWPQLGGVFDAGQIGLTEGCRSASTVIDLALPGKFKILRKGVALKQTLDVMHEFGIKTLHC